MPHVPSQAAAFICRRSVIIFCIVVASNSCTLVCLVWPQLPELSKAHVFYLVRRVLAINGEPLQRELLSFLFRSYIYIWVDFVPFSIEIFPQFSMTHHMCHTPRFRRFFITFSPPIELRHDNDTCTSLYHRIRPTSKQIVPLLFRSRISCNYSTYKCFKILFCQVAKSLNSHPCRKGPVTARCFRDRILLF